MNPHYGSEHKRFISRREDNHQDMCCFAAPSGLNLLLAWHTSMGFVGGVTSGSKEARLHLANVDPRSNETGNLDLNCANMKLYLHISLI